MSTTAAALLFTAPRRVEVRAVDLRDPHDGEVLVRTAWSGISGGTEMLAYRGEIDPSLTLDDTIGTLGGTFSFPFAFGYSCVGDVEVSRAPGIEEGSRVFAFHPHQDRFVAGAADVVPLGGTGDARRATLLPLVETALQVTLDAGPVLADDVVVVGLGAVGTLTAAMLARSGARVLGVEPLAWRRDAAAGLGVQATAPEDVGAELARRGVTDGVPLVVDATGRPEILGTDLALLAHEGTVLVASWYGTKDVSLPLGGPFHRRRLTIRSTQVSTIPSRLADRWTIRRRRAAAADLLGTLPLDHLATHAFPFARAAEAFAAIDRGEPGLIHAALCYG